MGWHFFKEGASKFQGNSFTSVGFLQTAKGPFADFYKSMIPDGEGRQRLDQSQTIEFWREYQSDVAGHYGFDEKQQAKAKEIGKLFQERLKEFHREHDDDIHEYLLECDRLEEAKADKIKDVEFLRTWIASKEIELRGMAKPWLDDLALMSQQLESNLRGVATKEQRAKGPCEITDRSSMWVDNVVKFVIIGIGVLLILGLFTRLASVAGMLFLLSVMSTQPPWVVGADTKYVYYQMVEVSAFLVLIAFSAGRFAGLDYVIYALRLRCCPPKTVTVDLQGD